jgi:RNA polymerase sigma-70 factor (ECF subfamily)
MRLRELFFRHRRPRSEESDEALLARFRDTGERADAEELFCRYSAHVLGICLYYLQRDEDAEDAAMEVFLAVLESASATPVANVANWLFFIARNHCFRQIKKDQRWRDLFVDLTEKNEADGVQNASSTALYERMEQEALEEDWERLCDAMSRLEAAQQQCLLLFYLEEKSYQQVAEITQIEPGKVRSHIQNGRRNLRRALTGSTKGENNEQP